MITTIKHSNRLQISDIVEKLSLLNAVSELMTGNEQSLTWSQLEEDMSWSMMDKELVRKIVLTIYTHPKATTILSKILPLNIIYLEDFAIMSDNWHNHDFFLTENVIITVDTLVDLYNWGDYGKAIKDRIINSAKAGLPSYIQIKAQFS